MRKPMWREFSMFYYEHFLTAQRSTWRNPKESAEQRSRKQKIEEWQPPAILHDKYNRVREGRYPHVGDLGTPRHRHGFVLLLLQYFLLRTINCTNLRNRRWSQPATHGEVVEHLLVPCHLPKPPTRLTGKVFLRASASSKGEVGVVQSREWDRQGGMTTDGRMMERVGKHGWRSQWHVHYGKNGTAKEGEVVQTTMRPWWTTLRFERCVDDSGPG